MKNRDGKYLTYDEFKKIYDLIRFSFTLLILVIEYFKKYYYDIEEMGDIIPILDCVKEKLEHVYLDLINIEVIE